MAEQDQDRNERATPFKLEEARKRGSVAKSADMLALAVMAAAVLFSLLGGLGDVPEAACAGPVHPAPGGPARLRAGADDALAAAGPRARRGADRSALCRDRLAAIVANVAQTGPVFSFQPLKPDFNRINPVTG
jgi:flagellar biosynthetic protein FlhB